MTEIDDIAKRRAQEGGFQFRQEFHWSEPTLDGHVETLDVLRKAKETGMKRVTVMGPDGPITLPIDEVIKVVESIIQDKIGNLPPKEQ